MLIDAEAIQKVTDGAEQSYRRALGTRLAELRHPMEQCQLRMDEFSALARVFDEMSRLGHEQLHALGKAQVEQIEQAQQIMASMMVFRQMAEQLSEPLRKFDLAINRSVERFSQKLG